MATNYGRAVIAAAQMFLDKIVKYPYIESRFAILSMSENLRYSIYGETTEIREVTAGKAANYNEDTGFVAGGDNGTVTWHGFKALWDRQKVLVVPFMDEVQSVLQGMKPSTVALLEMWWVQMGEEIDACVASNLYGSVPDTNKQVTSVGTPLVDADHIFDTLNGIKWKMYDAGVVGKIYMFVSSDVAASIGTKLLSGYGLANSAVLSIAPAVSQDVADRIGEKNLEVSLQVYKMDNCYIIPVPEKRMVTKVILNDGISVGQEEGGWSPASGVSGFGNIKVLAVPEAAAFVAVRHLVSNITVPSGSVGVVDIKGKLEGLNGNYYGGAMVQNIGTDQSGDWFKSMNRIKHGCGVFNNYTHTLFSVTDALVA